MVGGGEDGVAEFVEVELGIGGWLGRAAAAKLLQHGSRVGEFAGELGYGFEAGSAKAGGVELIPRQMIEQLAGDDDFMTPAGAFVEVTLGNAATVILTTEGTGLGG